MNTGSEAHRLAILTRLAVLDTDPEAVFDAVTRLAAQSFGTETATVSLVAEDRQWFKSCVGLSVSETPRDIAFCAHTIMGECVMVVLDALRDPRFAANPLVTGPPFIRFYAGAPLTIDGERVGTLCLLDPAPRADFDAGQRAMLAGMARIVEELLRQRIEVGERRELMRDLATRSRQLVLAESLAGVGHWTLQPATGAVTWSDEVYRIHGVTSAEFDPQYDDALAFFAPGDQARIAARIEATWRTGADLYYTATLHRRPDCASRHVLVRGEVQRDATGAPALLFGVLQDITEQEALLAQVRADRERYELLTRNATDVIAVCSPDLVLSYVSPAVATVFGYAPEALVGTACEDITHPEDRASLSAQLRALGENRDPGASVIILYRVLRTDGAWIWVEAHARAMRGATGALEGFQYVARDITLRHEAEAAARYRLLADNATDMIARVSLTSRIIFITPACERVLGFAQKDMLGRSSLSFVHPDDKRSVSAQYAAFIAAGRAAAPLSIQFRAICRDGTVIWLEARPRLCFDSEGRPVELHDAIRDVTAAKQVERALIDARQAADAAAQATSAFLANMSHELRTPLTGILGFADVLATGPSLSQEDRRYARLIKTAGSNLLAIVNDVLDLSKIEAGAIKLQSAPVDLRILLRETLELVRDAADGKGLALQLDVPGEPVCVLADADRLRQIVLNLLGNAVKFTTAGSVRMVLRCTAHAEMCALQIAVHDTGIGIAPDRLEAMFGRFEQADNTIALRFGGTGLGLSICRALVNCMGGSIAVHSLPGSGSSFTVALEAPRAAALQAAEPAPRPLRTADLAGMRVLLAEDIDINQELVALFLAPYGVDIDIVGDGREALRAAEGTRYDLILMDMQMPLMDGLEAARRIRQGSGPSRLTPIIALTANVMAAEVENCMAAGCNGHIGKPMEAGALIGALESWAPARATAAA